VGYDSYLVMADGEVRCWDVGYITSL